MTTLKEYLTKEVSNLVSMVPDLSECLPESRLVSVLYQLQRLTAKIVSDLKSSKIEPTETAIEEHQLALLLLDIKSITKAFNLPSGCFEELSHDAALENEEAYNNFRHTAAAIIRSHLKENTCCCC